MLGLLKPVPPAKLQKLILAARRYPCQNCGKLGFTVPCHSNAIDHGKGVGLKVPDHLIAYMCGDPGGCHDQVDGRSAGMPYEAKRAMWNAAHVKTVALWFRDGLVVVA